MSLKGIKVVTKANGRRFVYFRAPGGKLYPLPDLPSSDPAFLAAYSKLATEYGARETAPSRTLNDLARAYYQSRRFLDLKPSTQVDRRRIVDAICKKATLPTGVAVTVRSIGRRHIQSDLDKMTPGSAKNRLKAWRALMHTAMQLEWITLDPSRADLDLPRYRRKSFPRWTTDDVVAFCARWPVGTQQRTAFELLYWLGCRRGDVVALGWQNVKDGWITWRQEKTGDMVELPIAPPLAIVLEQCSRSSMTFLETAQGASRSKEGFGNWFREACDAAAVEKSAHGLRHHFGSTIAEGGIEASAGAAAQGHRSVAEQVTYRRSADRRTLALRAMGGLFSERGLETVSAQIGNQTSK